MAVLRTGPTESLIQGLHQSVFRAEKRIGLVLFGKGNIGSRWLELFAREQSTLSARTGFEFVLAGVVDSRRSLLSYDGLDASRALAFFNDEAVEQDEESLFLWMRAHPYDDLVVLDVTASQQLADQYLDFASHGFHVISANKLAGASDSNKYRQIHDAFEKTGRHWLYNATVGAGLPINHTVRDLIDSGDTILSISGIFSGTLSWLFLQFDGSVPFTELVDQAWQQGLTEPDPRDDLSGKDVMRKLVILAREAGYNIEPDQAAASTISLKMAMNLTSRWCNDWKRPAKWGWCCATWRVSMPTAKRVWAWKRCVKTIRWHHYCHAITSLPSKAAGIATTRW